MHLSMLTILHIGILSQLLLCGLNNTTPNVAA